MLMKKRKETISKEDLSKLQEASERLFMSLSQVCCDKLPELSELLVSLSLKVIVEKKKYKSHEEITVHDFLEATDQMTAWLEFIERKERH